MNFLVVLLCILVTVDIIQRGRAMRDLKDNQKRNADVVEQYADSIDTLVKFGKHIVELDKFELAFPNKLPFNVDDGLYWILEAVVEHGATVNAKDDSLGIVMEAFKALFGIDLVEIGTLKTTKRVVLAIPGTDGFKTCQKLPLNVTKKSKPVSKYDIKQQNNRSHKQINYGEYENSNGNNRRQNQSRQSQYSNNSRNNHRVGQQIPNRFTPRDS